MPNGGQIKLGPGDAALLRKALRNFRVEDAAANADVLAELTRCVAMDRSEGSIDLPQDLCLAAATVLSAASMHPDIEGQAYERLGLYITNEALERGAVRFGSFEDFVRSLEKSGVLRFEQVGIKSKWWKEHFEQEFIGVEEAKSLTDTLKLTTAWLYQMPEATRRLKAYEKTRDDYVPIIRRLVGEADRITKEAARVLLNFCSAYDSRLIFLLHHYSDIKGRQLALTNLEFLLHGLFRLNSSLMEIKDEWFSGHTDGLAVALMPDENVSMEMRRARLEERLYGVNLISTYGKDFVARIGGSEERLRSVRLRGDLTVGEMLVGGLNAMNTYQADPVVEHARLRLLLEAIREAKYLAGLTTKASLYSPQKLSRFESVAKAQFEELRKKLVSRLPTGPQPSAPGPEGIRGSIDAKGGVPDSASGGTKIGDGPVPAAVFNLWFSGRLLILMQQRKF